ncbi:MAG: hypothetical protein GY795_11265 [Desulfobacterales bacterium]|nr:hypothetical protein [Desulfobacterales bacterium]
MTKKCIKCGYTRKPEDMAPEYECPGCGIVYDKVEKQLKNNQPQPEKPKQGWISNISLNTWRIIIALPFIGVGLYFFYLAWSGDDSTIAMLGTLPMVIGLWICGVDVNVDSRGNSVANIGGDSGSDGCGGGD